MLLAHIRGQFKEPLHFTVIGTYIHGRSAEHITGSYQNGITYFVYKGINFTEGRQLFPAGLVNANPVKHGREFVPVFGIINIFSLRAEDGNFLRIKGHGQVIGYLASGRENHPPGRFQFNNIHNPFKSQLVKIEPVAHVVIGRNGFRIVIDHYRTPAFPANSQQRLHTAPVKFNGTPNAVGSGAQYHNGPFVLFIINIMSHPSVGQVKVIGPGRVFGGQGVNLFYHRQNAQRFSYLPYFMRTFVIHFLFPESTCDLEIGEALALGQTKQFNLLSAPITACFIGRRGQCFQRSTCFKDQFQLLEKPSVNFGQPVYLVNRITGTHCLAYYKNTHVSRFA